MNPENRITLMMVLIFVIRILEQTSVCEKYRLSSGNATKNIPEQTDSEASKAHLTLDCAKSNSSSDECKHQRDVSEAHIDHVGVENEENYIFTTYFTSKPDPQRRKNTTEGQCKLCA